MKTQSFKAIAALLFALVLTACAADSRAAGEEKITLIISGGHETDRQDHGRPVVLIANALGVKPEVFREAFTQVKPAPAGTEPEPAQVRRNKAALMSALEKFGVTNELLDRVSNHYRYRPGGDRIWPTTPAAAAVTLKDGAVAAVVITEAGSGYSSPPAITVPGHPEIKLQSALAFGKDLKKNGGIARIGLAGTMPPKTAD